MSSRRAFLKRSATALGAAVVLPDLLAACASPATVTSTSTPAGSPSASPSASGLDLAALEEAGRKEGGTAVYYTFASDAPLVDMFKAAYPWAAVNNFAFATVGQIKAKFLLEKRGGVNTADVVVAFGTDMPVYLTENAVASVTLPNDALTLKDIYDPLHNRHPLNQVLFVYGYNPNAGVKPPRDLFELADPSWKGKLAFDNPSNGASSATVLASRRPLWGDTKWRQWLAGLASNNVLLTGSAGAAYDAVLQGQRQLALCGYQAMITQKPGTPMVVGFYDQIVASPTYMFVNSAAPHPNMARLFANWLIGPQAQAWYATQGRIPGADIDSPASLAKLVPAGESVLRSLSLDGWMKDPDGHVQIYKEYWPN